MVIVAFIFDLRTLQVVWCTCTTLCKYSFLLHDTKTDMLL